VASAQSGNPEVLELTILMPCLNEAETLETCIRQARVFLDSSGIVGEVLIADNGSTDGSQELAERAGARVVHVAQKGYGAALIGGIEAARGTYVAMGDADDSYDFGTLLPFVEKLRAGADLVMGNRFQGGVAPGAMPPLHRYLGNPVLSFVGRLFFRAPVGDFHCGLRAFRRDSIMDLQLRTTGMEFASEMVVKACLAELDVREVPTTLRPDGRSRPPHLRSWRDGWRHLRFLMLYSPRWLFLYPGLLLTLLGLVSTIALVVGPVEIGNVGFDVGTLLFAFAATILGYQGVLFALLSHDYAEQEGFLPRARFHRFRSWLDLEKSIGLGVGIFLLGVVLTFVSLWQWRDAGFGSMPPADSVRSAVPGVLGLVLGNQTVLFGLFLSFLRIRVVRPAPEVAVEDPTLRASRAEPAPGHVDQSLLGEVAADADTPARGALRG
jgi:glycosyltransferase involved in cell wall biosynthesis